MFHLSRKTDYGLILLLELARRKLENKAEPTSLSQIAKKYAISFFFLQKVAKELREKNVIEATRGKDGGYKLTKNMEEINLYEIFTALEGEVVVMSCFAFKPEFKALPSGNLNIAGNLNTKCSMPAHKGLSLLNEELQKTLTKISLTDFFKTSIPNSSFPSS